MRKFHIAIGVENVELSVQDYSLRLQQPPQIVIAGEYALWRTESLNFSIRKVKEQAGVIRHLGWEDPTATEFSSETDVNGILWEKFSQQDQLKEITSLWPG